MNKILYFLFGLIILLLAILFAFSIYDDESDFEKSPMYEYTTLCSNKHCLPLDNLLINQKVVIDDPEKIGNEFSQWLVNNSETCFVRAKYSKEHQCQLTAYNSIDVNALYLQFNLNNVLHDSIINKDYFDEKIKPEQLLKDEKIFNSWQINSQVQKVIVNFLYHLTHLDNSKFKPWILTLPKSISPLYNNFTYYELQLIEGDNVHNWVLQIVDQYKRDYKTLLSQIRNETKNNKKEEEFFNGYQLNLQDYAYTRYLCDIYGWNIQNQATTVQEKKKEKNSKLFLVPGSNCLMKKAPETLVKYDGFHQVQNFSSFQFYSDRQFKYSDVIEENYEIQDNSILLVTILYKFYISLDLTWNQSKRQSL